MNYTIFEGIEYRHFNHLYSVSACGNVLRLNQPFTPKARKKDGYMQLGHKQLLHRVVAHCWLEKPEGAKHVHHKNHNKTDNRACNLEWLTPKQHASHHPEARAKPMPESARAKLRQHRLGTHHTEEAKEKLRQASIAAGCRPPSWEGKKHKAETIEKMRTNHAKNQSCVVFGIEYPSFAKAGEALNIRPLTLRKRCHSKNFPDYQISV